MKGKTMLAFHGDDEIKAHYLSRVEAHIEADELIHGVYWENGKGCAVGCTIHSSNHAAYETELGIPSVLARLEDGIFEGLENGRAKEWPKQFLSAIQPGADLSLIWPQLAVWMLIDPQWGVKRFAKSERSQKTIQDIADAYQGVVDGGKSEVDWRKLRDAADAYAAYAYADADAAYAAANAATAASAYAAANAATAAAYAASAYANAAAADAYAAAAAAAAAYAYASAYAYAAYAGDANARIKWRTAQADKLLELLNAAPVPQKEFAA